MNFSTMLASLRMGVDILPITDPEDVPHLHDPAHVPHYSLVRVDRYTGDREEVGSGDPVDLVDRAHRGDASYLFLEDGLEVFHVDG